MDPLQLREKEIFETLKAINKCDFVIIGGYAVNAYTFPRFSDDCDIVVNEENELAEIEKKLLKLRFIKKETDESLPYSGKFFRYEKEIAKNFKVSIDILFQKILDRQTDAIFDASWVFDNSQIKQLKGKTISETLKLRIIKIDALIAMKILCCRLTDIRDVFMLIVNAENPPWIRDQVGQRFSFAERYTKLKDKITSKQFKDDLQGIFGRIDEKLFEKHKSLILELEKM